MFYILSHCANQILVENQGGFDPPTEPLLIFFGQKLRPFLTWTCATCTITIYLVFFGTPFGITGENIKTSIKRKKIFLR